ncbi:hypothetical protein AB8P51_08875 [Muriicola sp. SD30]|uniref:hypothetical protein n=1 Tax=Muriicola sp. SD30 TaxID=3240936 RepID=UPI00350FC8B4
MKTLLTKTLSFLLILSSINAHSQSKLGNKKMVVNPTLNRRIQPNASNVSMCRPMDIRRTETLLREQIAKTMKLRLDRSNGYVEILGRKQGIAFTEFVFKKPGHNWKYFLQDMNSTEVSTSYSSKNYYLNIRFETDRAEIKGRCPGCANRFEDSRAPDIQWRNPKIKVKLKPVAYNGSFTFEIADVSVEGKFETNGAIKAALPSIITHFKRQIRKAVESQIKMVMNSNSIKLMLADVFRAEVQNLGISTVRMVDLSKSNIYLCQ